MTIRYGHAPLYRSGAAPAARGVLGLGVLGLAATGCSSSQPATAAAAAAGASASAGQHPVVVVADTKLGRVLVDGTGRTLYLFEKDRPDESTCTGACAVDWPPYHGSGTPSAGSGVQAQMLRTIHRPDGTTQVAYHGHPLYYFAGDTRPGQFNGQNLNAFGAGWYVVGPAGDKVEGTGH